jgi:hypothetical protein
MVVEAQNQPFGENLYTYKVWNHIPGCKLGEWPPEHSRTPRSQHGDLDRYRLHGHMGVEATSLRFNSDTIYKVSLLIGQRLVGENLERSRRQNLFSLLFYPHCFYLQ